MSEINPITMNIIKNLKKFIINNKNENIDNGCTPIIGAGVSNTVFDKLKTSSVIGSLLADQDNNVPAWVPRLLPVVTEYLTINAMEPRTKVIEHIKEVSCKFKEEKNDYTNTLIQLADLDFPLYITTNYDDLLEEALLKIGKHPRRVLSGWFLDKHKDIHKYLDDLNIVLKNKADPEDKEPIQFEQPSCQLDGAWDEDHKINKPIVFHLHGHIAVPESMVLTEEDYVDFLVAFANSNSTASTNIGEITDKMDVIPAYVATAFKNSSRLVAIGYSLKDLNFQVLLRAIRKLKEREDNKLSISIQLEPSKSACFQGILQNRISEVLSDPDILPNECIRIVRMVLDKMAENNISKETEYGLALQENYLKQYFEKALKVNVCWCNAKDFINALYKVYYPDNKGDKK